MENFAKTQVQIIKVDPSEFLTSKKFFGCEQCSNIFSSEGMLDSHIIVVHGKNDSAIKDKVQLLETLKTNVIKVEPPDIDQQVSLDSSGCSFKDSIKIESTLFDTVSVKVESNDGTSTNNFYNESVETNFKKEIFLKLEPPEMDPQISFVDKPTLTLASFNETIKIEPTFIEKVKVESSELVNENIEANQVETVKDVSSNKQSKICFILFDRNEMLAHHTQSHSDERTYSCKTCSKTFGCSSNLKRHMQIHSTELPFSCETCGENFKLYNTMKLHMKIHIADQQFSCSVCGKSFILNSSLKVHLKTHLDERPHSCKICNKGFRCTFNLKRHMLTHSNEVHMTTLTDEKPHSCEICYNRFRCTSNLKRHMLTHSNEQPFSCEICSTRFKLAYNLKAHLKTHSTDPPLIE